MYFKLRVRGLSEETFSPNIKRWKELRGRVKNLAEIRGIPFVRENVELTRVELRGHEGKLPEPVYPGGEVRYEGGEGTGQPERRLEVWRKRRLTAMFKLEPLFSTHKGKKHRIRK